MNPTDVSTTAVMVSIDMETASQLLSQIRPGESFSSVIAHMCERSDGATERELYRKVTFSCQFGKLPV